MRRSGDLRENGRFGTVKKRAMILCSLVLLATVAHGEQAVRKDAFWEKLASKLEKLTPAKKSSTTTAVGGVRGAKSDDSTDIYWKGKDKPVEMAEDELQKFNRAVECRMKGDNEQALKQFEEFLAAYPQSAFKVEGLQAVDKLKQEIAAAKVTPAVQPAPAPAK